jgi:uncharacterized membrane protein YcaP (DUF421 family)
MILNLVVVVRSTMAFFVLLIYARILGKQQISELTFFDYVNGITIGSIAGTMSTDTTSTAFHHFLGLTTWAGLTLLIHLIGIRVRLFDRLVGGEPTVVIHNGKILEDNMRKLRYPYIELMEQLRQANAWNIGDVEFAVYEQSGKLSVLLKSQKRPVTPHDLDVPTEYEGIETELITDGKIIEQNLAELGKDRIWLMTELEKQGIKNIEEVAFASLNTQGELYIDRYHDDLGEKTKDLSDFPDLQ